MKDCYSEDAMRKAGVAHSKSSKDMESHVFLKAKTRLFLLPDVPWCCGNSKEDISLRNDFARRSSSPLGKHRAAVGTPRAVLHCGALLQTCKAEHTGL
ncbi:hypothetical protein A6R68_07915 [Neotoma lepida]|uniref:Uncharacterized protein n=1 Tax=Neotoma lepida TaxID=56216 RepID=A0A1A6GDU6_NEOLE|nr:hypothetical protein A6R68_07915 [Neotoma lepida]